ncbi:phytoene desaturase family protein [Paenibacillus vini]|uniref:4,4'-diaponeurosporene oxygenase n=1 Tax=Paenibacillus vini TaxID=1476024 RepID=A0ABQ4M525_9BACL|nr:NAD(P)/FAD-dependent oxidoreductase [Paenibacillus vini]GIP51038.1 dehydrogenase [Paenibacillus vini]
MTGQKENRYDVAVIGGGLTGLTAAVYLARSGKSVLLLEKDSLLGGLAQTERMNGALFNLGPHAMYEGGAALQILRELNCLPDGGYASKGSMIGIWQGKMVSVPQDLTLEENAEWGKLMGGLSLIDTHSIRSTSIQDWVDRHVRHERVRFFFYAMCRQWSYCNNMSELSAGYVIEQGQLAGQGVRYVDGGWQTVVNDLREAAIQAGAVILTGRSAEQIMHKDGIVDALLLSDGTKIEVDAVIAGSGPNEVCRLVQGADRMSIGKWKEESSPLYAACLDIALRHLPHPERVFALGLDQPLYFSKHSGAVQLSDNGAHVLHAMRYNGNEATRDGMADEAELTRLLDLLEPGWEREVVAIRFTPNVLVAHDLRTVRHGGAGPAPGPIVPEIHGLYVAGDWVGGDGRLADAGMASAKQAALEVIRNV